MNGRIVIAAAGLAALAACGPPAQEPESAAGSEAPAAYAAPPPVEAAAASRAPAFAPAYPGAQVVANMNAVQDGRRGGVYAFQTADAPDEVFAFYRARAEAEGLSTAATAAGAGGRAYAANGAAGDLSVTVAQAGGLNYVQVTWSAN